MLKHFNSYFLVFNSCFKLEYLPNWQEYSLAPTRNIIITNICAIAKHLRTSALPTSNFTQLWEGGWVNLTANCQFESVWILIQLSKNCSLVGKFLQGAKNMWRTSVMFGPWNNNPFLCLCGKIYFNGKGQIISKVQPEVETIKFL